MGYIVPTVAVRRRQHVRLSICGPAVAAETLAALVGEHRALPISQSAVPVGTKG